MALRMGLGLVLVLGFAVCTLGARLVGRLSPGLDLSRADRFQVDDTTRARLTALQDRVLLTWFATPAADMPSHLRGLDRDVRDVLTALADASDGKLKWQVVDPQSDPELADFATRLGLAPYTTRDVRGDRWTERSVWSTLHITYGPYPPATIRALEPDDVPGLRGLLLAHLEQMEHPRRPVVALDAPDDFDELRAALAARAEVIEHTFSRDEPPPTEADLFLWIDPARGTEPLGARDAEALEALLETGRSVVIAGGMLAHRTDDDGRARLVPGERDLAPFLAAFGVRPIEGLVLDEQSLLAADEGPVPFRILCNAYNQDFRTLPGQPNGTLLFDVPAAFAFDTPRLAELGLRAEVLATTSDRTWTQPLPAGPFALAELTPASGEAAPKLPLLARLLPEDPSRGSLILAASASPFRSFDEDAFAHRRLVDVLLDHRLSNERLVAIATPRLHPERVPFLSSATRLALRAWSIALAPAVLLALALVRGARGGRLRAKGALLRPVLVRGSAAVVAVLLCVLFVTTLCAGSGTGFDLTADGHNSLSPVTRKLAARAPVRVRRVVSARDRLPPELRATALRADRLLRELARDAELVVERVDPATLDESERLELEREGVGPVEIATRDEESRVVHRVYASLVLDRPGDHGDTGDARIIDLSDPDAADELEFRVALALHALEVGRAPRVGFASDLPRMTAAEAWDYQTSGLFAPFGKDEYAAARERLERAGFDVVHINPRAPELPLVDALVWLQPRRDASRMLATTVGYLRAGGRVLLAAQYFTIEPRRDRTRGSTQAFLPRDQVPDAELYWPAAGINLVRELVFDRLSSVQPFLVRAPAESFATTSVVTRTQGDQVFVAPSHIALDQERLAELGLEARTWIATSERSWTANWEGGELSAETLGGPTDEYTGPLPLVVRVDGTFPKLAEANAGPQVATPNAPEPLPGTLVLVACSEMFKDRRLRAPDARADRLLIDAVSALTLGDELASVVAERPVARGFAPIPEAQRLRWRALVTAGVPLALVIGWLVRAAVQRGGRP